MITQLQADQWTEDFLGKLQNKKFFQKHAVFEYSCLLATGQHHLFDWPKINGAIINRKSLVTMIP